ARVGQRHRNLRRARLIDWEILGRGRAEVEEVDLGPALIAELVRIAGAIRAANLVGRRQEARVECGGVDGAEVRIGLALRCLLAGGDREERGEEAHGGVTARGRRREPAGPGGRPQTRPCYTPARPRRAASGTSGSRPRCRPSAARSRCWARTSGT